MPGYARVPARGPAERSAIERFRVTEMFFVNMNNMGKNPLQAGGSLRSVAGAWQALHLGGTHLLAQQA